MIASISVVVTTHNRFTCLVEACRSAARQTLTPNEIIIVDDGSATPVAPSWQEAVPFATDIPIRFVRLEDEGPSKARNAGARIACGKFIAFLDDDDLMAPEYLDAVHASLARDSADVSVTWLRCFDGNSEWPGKHFPSDHLTHDPYRKNIGFVGSNIVIRRGLFMDLGGFDANLLGSEDKDLYIRLRKSGAQITVVEKELVRYRIHGGEQASGSFRFHPFQVSGKTKFLRKHGADMSVATYRALAADAGWFRLMGGKTWADRWSGLGDVVRFDITKLRWLWPALKARTAGNRR